MDEKWREHPMFKGYEGSTLGNIRSWRSNAGTRRWEPRLLKQTILLYPYPVIRTRIDGKQKTILVHRFIAECFIPNPEKKECINHKNGIKTDNRVENLEWVTYGENQAHAFAISLKDKKGESHHFAKLTDTNVLKIREDYATGNFSQKELAQRYGVTYSAIGMIISGRRWSHLKGEDSKDHRAGRRCPTKRKLTAMQVVEIREALKNGVSQRKLAKKYGISQTPIYDIAHGKYNKEIP